MALPPGYQPHTNPQYAATYMWNPQTNDVRPIEHVPEPPAAAPAPMTPPQAAAPAHAPVGYGTVDIRAMDQDQGHVFASREKKIFIDIPKPNSIGETTHRIVRLLPPWRVDLSIPYVKYAQHMLPASLHPAPGERKWIAAGCYDTEGGPGNCPICAARKTVLEHDPSNADADRAGPRSKYVWQALDLENLNQHFHQKINPVTQQPELNAEGRPVYEIVPGIIKSGAQLWKAMRGLFPEKGDATHIETGYPIKIKRTKTGPHDMNVEYGAVDLAPTPLDEQLRPVLANLFDLHHEFLHYLPAEEMQAIANHMLQLVHPAQVQVPAAAPMPQASYAAPQGLQGMQPPVPPPQAAPAPYQAAPAPYQAAPAPYQAAPRPVGAIPPAGAPGGVPPSFQPGAPAPAHPGVPPTAAPSPGLPGGFGAPPPAPAAAPAPAPAPAPAEQTLTGGQTPEEFEASLPTKPGQAPF